MKTSKNTIVAMLAPAILLIGCAEMSSYNVPSANANERPLAFHDTRLQYALVTGEDQTLAKDFDMRLPPSMTERIVAGAVLPFTAAFETILWPVSTSIKTWAPAADHGRSAK